MEAMNVCTYLHTAILLCGIQQWDPCSQLHHLVGVIVQITRVYENKQNASAFSWDLQGKHLVAITHT